MLVRSRPGEVSYKNLKTGERYPTLGQACDACAVAQQKSSNAAARRSEEETARECDYEATIGNRKWEWEPGIPTFPSPGTDLPSPPRSWNGWV